MTSEDQSTLTEPLPRRKILGFVFATIILTILTLHVINERSAARDWEAYKEAAAARGEPMDWSLNIPVPPPAAENFYASPIVERWMPKKGEEPSGSFALPKMVKAAEGGPVNLVEIQPSEGSKAGPPRLPEGFKLPAPPTIKQLRTLPASAEGEHTLATIHLWLEQWNQEFEQFRAAGKRAHVFIPGDYSGAATIPVQNFIYVRSLAHTLASKAKVNLILGRPEEARRDLESLEAALRGLETRPATLVAAMIRAALAGVYQEIVQDGLAENLWKPDQIQSLQEYLLRFDLLAHVQKAIAQGERVGIAQVLDAIGGDVVKTYGAAEGKTSRLQEMVASLHPRGWVRLNQVYIAGIYDEGAAIMNPELRRYHPKRAQRLAWRIQDELSGFHPTRMLASVIIPNFPKAFETAARLQTYNDLTAVACAVEIHKSKKGAYPSQLSDLGANLPHDLVTGKPFKYKIAGDSYLLYAVGFDARDDNGSTKTDLVWPRFI